MAKRPTAKNAATLIAPLQSQDPEFRFTSNILCNILWYGLTFANIVMCFLGVNVFIYIFNNIVMCFQGVNIFICIFNIIFMCFQEVNIFICVEQYIFVFSGSKFNEIVSYVIVEFNGI